MSDNQSVQTTSITSDEQIRNVLRRQIQRAYDKREFSRPTLAAESGVNVFKIDAIVSTDVAKHRKITCEDAFNLAYTLGDRAVSALVGTMCYTASRSRADGVDVGQLVASILPHVSTIATAASDGRIDHTEALSCRDAADGIIATMMPLSSAGGRA